MKRAKSYHDLSADERVRYDRLRSIERRLRDPGGSRAKRCGSRKGRYQAIRLAANAMLGIEPETDTRVARSPEKGRAWRGSATFYAPPHSWADEE